MNYTNQRIIRCARQSSLSLTRALLQSLAAWTRVQAAGNQPSARVSQVAWQGRTSTQLQSGTEKSSSTLPTAASSWISHKTACDWTEAKAQGGGTSKERWPETFDSGGEPGESPAGLQAGEQLEKPASYTGRSLNIPAWDAARQEDNILTNCCMHFLTDKSCKYRWGLFKPSISVNMIFLPFLHLLLLYKLQWCGSFGHFEILLLITDSPWPPHLGSRCSEESKHRHRPPSGQS